MIPLVVPVLNNFRGFAELVESVDYPVLPIVISNWKAPLSVSASYNVGLKRVQELGHRYALMSNDDVIFHKGSIEKLIKRLEDVQKENATIVLVGAIVGYACFVVDVPLLIGKVGYFDENFKPAYYEDWDLHYRIRLAHLDTIFDSTIIVTHRGSVTYNNMRIKRGTNPQRDYYVTKWGGDLGNEKYTIPFNGNGS